MPAITAPPSSVHPSDSVVLVVGAGPVGLTMAAELTRFGVRVRIIDKTPHRSQTSKALVLWSRTLELLDRLGCGASFRDAGLKVRAANIFAGQRSIARIALDQVDSPHPFALMLEQSETERLLEDELGRRGVVVERQVELVTFEQVGAVNGSSAPTAVRATLRHVDGHEESVDVSWLIGCDGAHSTVRHQLGVHFEGTTLPSDWMLADVHLAGAPVAPDEINTWWNADGALAIFPIAPGRFRMVADVGPHHAAAPPAANAAAEPDSSPVRSAPTLEEVQRVLDARGPAGVVASDPVWLASFRINERMVAEYRHGRVFLAGDAAHVHSPAGGQGMNTGMQDAFNLAWKLATVVYGKAAEDPLLASYSIERSAVATTVLRDSGRLTALAIMRGTVAQTIRNHAAMALFGLGPVRRAMAERLTELSVGYPESPLTFKDGRARSHRTAPLPGERAPIPTPDVPVGAGETPRWALFAADDSTWSAFLARRADLAAVLESQPRTPFQDGAIRLVRPDGYIALVAEPGDWASVESALDRVFGITSPAARS